MTIVLDSSFCLSHDPSRGSILGLCYETVFFLGVLVILSGIRAESPQVRGRHCAFLVVLQFILHTVSSSLCSVVRDSGLSYALL